MENLSMCRMCLTTDVRLCTIASHLRDMYERITSVTFKREDRRPLVACYICHARLQNCNRLRNKCLRSEELLTEMMSSGVLKPQDMLNTNTFRVVSTLHLSLGHALQDNTECNVMEAASEVIRDAELDQLYTEDIVTGVQEEQCAQIEYNNQCSHLEDPLDIIKEEADDVETDAEYINFEEGNIKTEEIGSEPDIADPSTQSADNICPKVVKIVLERIDLNSSRVGARVSKKPKIAALKDTEHSTTQIEIESENPITTSKPIETCDKVDINKQYQCIVCKICFNRKDHLKSHILTHTGDKSYQCNVCKKCFIRKKYLKGHIRTHTGDKPYQCNVCKKCFLRKIDLKVHIRTHTGYKPYQCNVCKKGFIRKDYLKTHIRTHTGDKPYQCNICQKCFIQKNHLKIHIRTHTSDKPYQCKVCKKGFIRKDNLKRHIRTHTDDKPYQCNVCKKCFSDPSSYSRHIRIHKR